MRDDDDSADQEERQKSEIPTVPPREGEENVYESATMIGSLQPELLALLREQDEQACEVGTTEEANVPIFISDEPPPDEVASPEQASAETPVSTQALAKVETSSPPEPTASLLTPQPGQAGGEARVPAFPRVARVQPEAAVVSVTAAAAVSPSPPPVAAPEVAVPPVAAFHSDAPAFVPPTFVTPPPEDPVFSSAPSPENSAFGPVPEVYAPLFAPLPGSPGAASESAPGIPVGLIWAIVVAGAFGIAVLILVLTR